MPGPHHVVGHAATPKAGSWLIRWSKPINWEDARGDLIKRAYWHCAIMETYVACFVTWKFAPDIDRGLHLELDLPLTGLIQLEDRVGIPSFNSPFCEADHRGNQSSHFEAHYASQVALRRLCANLHRTINECKYPLPPETWGILFLTIWTSSHDEFK
jgi:hypothetical protein